MRDCKTQQSTEGLQQIQQLIPSVLVDLVGHAVRNVKENKVYAENLRIELIAIIHTNRYSYMCIL